MSVEFPGFKYSLNANADLSASQFLGLVCTAGNAAVAGTQGLPIIGVLQNKPPAGHAAEIMQSGITKMRASAAITVGARVAVANDGRAIAAATGNVVIGIALEASTAGNQIIAVLLTGAGHNAP